MRIYYRGYVIDNRTSSADYAVLGRRPVRAELVAYSDAQRAMKWIDGDVNRRGVSG